MPTKINHVALVTTNYTLVGRFYEAMFGLRAAGDVRHEDRAINITDGYVGMNINQRAPGRQGSFDHFGFEVDDVEAIKARVAERYPDCKVIQRPGNRPFAAFSMHDPFGNVFDLSQEGLGNRRGVYSDKGAGEPLARIRHFMLRSVDSQRLHDFYGDVLGLKEGRKNPDGSPTVTDGTVEIVFAPWDITDFLGSGIERPALDHLGFVADKLDAFQQHVAKVSRRNPVLAPRTLLATEEEEVRKKLFAACRPRGLQLADPDGVLLDVSEN